MHRSAVTGASSGADRRNRVGLAVVGLLLTAAGGYGLARSWGAFGDRSASEPVADDNVRDFVARHPTAFWATAAALAIVLAVVGLRWLRAQLAAASPRRIDLTHRGDRGVTVVVPAGAADALAADIERYRGVTQASARLIGDSDTPEVDLRVDVAADCDVPAVRARIESDALARFRQAVDLPAVQSRLEFRLTDTPPGPRVR